MSNKVYGFCAAGCRYRVPTYDEFEKSASIIKLAVDYGAGNPIEIGKTYKIIATEKDSIDATLFSACVYLDLRWTSGDEAVSDNNERIEIRFPYDAYRNTIIFTLDAVAHTDYDETIYIAYTLNGERLTKEVAAGYYARSLEVVAATFVGELDELYLVNTDASIEAEDGASAYEIARANGFEGTEAEWLASLHGADGKDGVITNAEVVQELGTNTDKVMSQKAVTNLMAIVTENLELDISENLCNPDALEVGNVTVTGSVTTNTIYMHTEQIAVGEGDVLTFYYPKSDAVSPAAVTAVTAYDAVGNAVSASGATKVSTYIVPEGVASVIISFYASYITNNGGFMVLRNYDGTPSSFIEYGDSYYATEKFLKKSVGVNALTDELKCIIENEHYIEADYINDEVERVKRETLSSEGILNFIFSTDQHLKSDLSDLYMMKEIAKVANSGRFDFLCMGGDMIQSGDTSWYRAVDSEGNVTEDNGFKDKKETVVAHMTTIADTLKDAECPVFYCQGNHDVCFGAYQGARDYNAYHGYTQGHANYKDPNAQSLTPREFFRLLNNRLGETVVWDDDNPYGNYFYKDFDRAKIRVIILQTQDVFNDDGTVVDTVNNTSLHPNIQQEQFSWFCNKALNFMGKGDSRTEWGVVILSHANAILGGVSGGAIGNEQCALIRGVLNAFMTGGTYTAATSEGLFRLEANVDFTEQGAVDFICAINGHVHADTEMNIGEIIDTYTVYTEPNIDRPCIQVSAASGTVPVKDYSASQLKDYFTIPERTEGTISCECFDIFSIDRTNRKIKTIRFGAGENREIDY